MSRVYTKIVGTGAYLPRKILTNHDLEQMLDTSDEWIVTRTGIKQRHIIGDDETVLDMAKIASLAALDAASLKPPDLDMIIVCTSTPLAVFPSTACYLQSALGVSGCPAFDLNAVACSAFVYAMSIADQYIQNRNMRNILIVGSEVMSRLVDWTDRNTCILFGDGAGAVVLTASSTPGILSTHLHANGDYTDILYMPLADSTAAGSLKPALQMAGNRLFKLAVNMLGELCEDTLRINGLSKQDLDYLIPHQANIRIIEALAKKLNLPMSKTAVTLPTQGNTSAASIPLALDKVIRDGKVVPGNLLLLESFGSGLTWGSALLRY